MDSRVSSRRPRSVDRPRTGRGLAYTVCLILAFLVVGVSVAGLVQGPALYRGDAAVAAGLTASTAGILVPGFLAHDLLNLVVALPVLLGTLWLSWRGSLIGLLLVPGALFYLLYTYTSYLVGAPFSVLFLPYVALVVLSAYATMGIVASVDGAAVKQRPVETVPARIVGGILLGMAALTFAQDAGGALFTALTGAVPIARHIWTADLAVEVPALVVGGVLLWRREPLGYAVGAALLLQFGLTPVVLAAISVLQPVLTNSPTDTGLVIGLLIFSVVAFAPLPFFVRGAGSPQSNADPFAP